LQYLGLMFRRLLAAAGALLAGFHLWVFGGHLADGRLLDPGVLTRWLVAGAIVGLLWHLRRNNVSILWGRKAVAVWILAAILHAPAAVDRLGAPDALQASDVARLIAQVSVVTALLSTLLFLTFARKRTGIAGPRFIAVADTRPLTVPRPRAFLLLAPRPPPLA